MHVINGLRGEEGIDQDTFFLLVFFIEANDQIRCGTVMDTVIYTRLSTAHYPGRDQCHCLRCGSKNP